MAELADVDNQLAALKNYEIEPQPLMYGARPNPMDDARELMVVQRQLREYAGYRKQLLDELRAAGVSVNPNTFA